MFSKIYVRVTTSPLETAEKLHEELRELRVQHYTLREQHDELRDKMKFFTKVKPAIRVVWSGNWGGKRSGGDWGEQVGRDDVLQIHFHVCEEINFVLFRRAFTISWSFSIAPISSYWLPFLPILVLGKCGWLSRNWRSSGTCEGEGCVD